MSASIAQLLFPHVTKTPEMYRQDYPQRTDRVVTRFAPSPTGFMHIGNLITAFTSRKYAQQHRGVYILRIEDTDQERYIDNGIQIIINLLNKFTIHFSEGPVGENLSSIGAYGPYIQSERRDMYASFLKHFVEKGYAYPCFLTPEECENIRNIQTVQKLPPGIYGHYASRRDKSYDDIKAMIDQEKPYVIRIKAPQTKETITFMDGIRGEVTMPINGVDMVLRKGDGFPTYHFAHLVDDYLMGTTHVIRGEEWLPSVPLHIQLFSFLGVESPTYCHIAPLLKMENGNKRKLSKRKDPESNVAYLLDKGYPSTALLEYLMTIMDPSYEERQKAHPEQTFHDFPIALDSFNRSGALFDEVKLRSVANNYFSRLSNDALFALVKEWSAVYHPLFHTYGERYPEYTYQAIAIERHTPKDPKRYTIFNDIVSQSLLFFDEERTKSYPTRPALPSCFDEETTRLFVEQYTQEVDLSLSVEDWFTQLKNIGHMLGFASSNADFKTGTYKGKTGDCAMFLRIQLCCATQTPDLYSVMQVLGKERVVARLRMALSV